jgi:predicted nucleotidyltransferase
MEKVVEKQLPVALPTSEIAEFCRRHHIRRLALFGSVQRPDFRPESDIDMLVEFEPGHTPGLAFFGMQEELAQILGHPVDLNTLQFINPYFRDEVQDSAEVIYSFSE